MAEWAANMKRIIYTLLALFVLVDAQLSETPLMIQGMCEENGGNYTAVMVGVNNFVTCVENDFGTVITEVSDAQNSTYAEVFKKYCAKSAQLKTCYHTLLDTTTPCVATKYQHLITTAKEVTDNALNYVCDNDGTVLTSFFTTGGPACLASKHDENLICFLNLYNTTIVALNTTWPLVDLSPIVQWYDTYVQCVVTNLATCESQTPSQVIQRLGEILRVGVEELANSAASGLAISSGFIGLIVFAAVYTYI